MFSKNDKVVYPGQGVAQINDIVEIMVRGVKTKYYELRFLNKAAMILVPVANAESVGMRPLSSPETIKAAFQILMQPAKIVNHYEFTASNWNKRNKKYQLQLRTGHLPDLSEIYRDLRFIETQKELSFGEKNLLNTAEALLVEEISLVQKLSQEKTMEQLRLLSTLHQKNNNPLNETV